MYKHTISPFGAFEKHTIYNENGDSFSIVPGFCANLIDLQFDNISVIESYQTPEALVENNWGKSIILFPYPNRLRDGQYTHEGKTYQFDINNVATQNSIHGFSNNVLMTVEKIETDTNQGAISCTYKHNGSHKAYPFKFHFKIKFILSKRTPSERGRELAVEMTFINLENKAIPVGLGWHPYYRISEKADDTSLQMPECQLVMIDERMLPTGEKQPFEDFNQLKKIDSTFLDNGFFITEKTNKAEVILQSDICKLVCWQETGFHKWNFVQVFTPPHRMSIAVEPMTCNVDAFNNKDGLVLLEPNESLSGKFGVVFSK